MMKRFMNHLRQAERGQSIIILAIAFVALLGFVGLTTDVSLMFVRYATIRRAVDSASLAAATQMRQGTEEATVAIAAKQFVEFHGLDSVDVLVESCQTLDRTANESSMSAEDWDILQANIEQLCTADQRKLVKVTVQAESPTVFLRLLGWDNFTLQAEAISETAALDVVLIMDVSESMLSETSYDDWAKIGMGWAFRPPHVDVTIAEPKITDGVFAGSLDEYWDNEIIGWQRANLATTTGQVGVNQKLWYSLTNGSLANFEDGSSLDSNRDPYYKVDVYDLDEYPVYDDPTEFPADVSVYEPREACRVRMFPASTLQGPASKQGRQWRGAGEPPAGARDDVYQTLAEMYRDTFGNEWDYSGTAAPPSEPFNWNGFIPTYDYYGCCNDPGTIRRIGNEPQYDETTGYPIMDSTNAALADFEFDDLICQPFKGARDAVELFLEKIDFIRGDRVAFVTFDRQAFLINPWNQPGQATGGSHMIDRYDYALQTLRRVVGVRAEPNFYVWNDEGVNPQPFAKWDSLAANSEPIDFERADGSSADGRYPAATELYHNYPVRDNCPYDDASLKDRYSTSDGIFGQTESLPYPRGLDQDGVTPRSWSNHQVTPWDGLRTLGEFGSSANAWYIPRFGYEYWASCRGTNVGAALREANNALVDPNTTRRFGAIWVMVLLGDGAAGASDPVRRNGEKRDGPNPYAVDASGDFDPVGGQYGVFGVCPYGTPGNPGELVQVSEEMASGAVPRFPFCSDEDYVTRHDCDFRPAKGTDAIQDNDYKFYADLIADGDLPGTSTEDPTVLEIRWNQARGNLYDLDIGDDCPDDLYDVDDYARDWADYVALRDPDSPTEELLPTIYTIGFGLTFGNIDSPDPNHIQDTLGEQLLRYIADVGDNNELDNDYYQYYNELGRPFGASPLQIDDGFGLRGPCQSIGPVVGEDPNGYDGYNGGPTNGQLDAAEIADMVERLDVTEDCGNYYNAPNADELEGVFDSIASKLFTRIAG